MPTLLSALTFRLAFQFGKDRDAWVDTCKFDPLEFPSGVSLKFQIGVNDDVDAGTFYDITDVASLRCEVKKMRPGRNRPLPEDPTYMQSDPVTPDAATITTTGWANGTEQHATFNFDPSETALDPGKYWLVFSGFLTGGEFDSFGWGEIEVVQDGTGVVSPVEPLDPSYYTADQIDDWRRSTGLDPTFNYYERHYSSLPVEETFSGSGTVLSYILGGVTRYRYIPDPYDPIEDAFYANFTNPTLSNLIVRKSLS